MTVTLRENVWTYATEFLQQLCDMNITVALATMGEKLSPEHWRQLAHMTRVRLSFRFKFKVSGLKFKVSGFRFQVSGFRFQVSGFRFQVSGFRFQVSSFRFQVSSFRFQVSGLKFQVSGLKLESSLTGGFRFEKFTVHRSLFTE